MKTERVNLGPGVCLVVLDERETREWHAEQLRELPTLARRTANREGRATVVVDAQGRIVDHADDPDACRGEPGHPLHAVK